jgi:hypothetical protein
VDVFGNPEVIWQLFSASSYAPETGIAPRIGGSPIAEHWSDISGLIVGS